MYWQKLFASLALLLAVCAGPPCLARESALLQPHALDPLQTNRIIVRWRTTGVAAISEARR